MTNNKLYRVYTAASGSMTLCCSQESGYQHSTGTYCPYLQPYPHFCSLIYSHLWVMGCHCTGRFVILFLFILRSVVCLILKPGPFTSLACKYNNHYSVCAIHIYKVAGAGSTSTFRSLFIVITRYTELLF